MIDSRWDLYGARNGIQQNCSIAVETGHPQSWAYRAIEPGGVAWRYGNYVFASDLLLHPESYHVLL